MNTFMSDLTNKQKKKKKNKKNIVNDSLRDCVISCDNSMIQIGKVKRSI